MNPPVAGSAQHAQREVDALIARAFSIIGLSGIPTVALLVAVLYAGFLPAWRMAMLALPIGVALAVGASLWCVRRQRYGLGVALVLLAGYAVITLIPLANGSGLRSQMLSFNGLLIVVAGVFFSVQAALVVGGLCLLALMAMYVAERAGLLGPAFGAVETPALAALALNGIFVLFSMLIAALFAGALVRSLRASKQQEHRFRQLLAIATEWYWEQDSELRYTRMTATDPQHAADLPWQPIGQPRWALPEMPGSSADWAAHRADLAAQRPFRDFVVCRPGADGQPRYISISGAPLFDDQQRFQGYWGISRDVSQSLDAQRRLQASELLYRELFARASTAFLLYREGRVLQANQAAVRLLGYDRAEQMVGIELLALLHPSYRERSAQRIASLTDAAVGSAVPPLEIGVLTRDGQTRHVQASGVRVATPDGPAILSVFIDLSERRATEQALAVAKEQAEIANRAKSRFLANMSHEIRTPLNGVVGLARMALNHQLEADKLDAYLTQLVGSAEHLAQLVSAVLDLSKIEAGELKTEVIEFDLHTLLRTLGQTFGELAMLKELDWQLELDPALPRHVRGDPTRVRQIVSNYLSNAIKFTARGRVRLQAAPAGKDRVRLSVVDHGIGIDAATLPRLFVPFTQADDSTTRRFGGTGLGLAICRELALLLGGEVGVDSRPGEGSRFWVELPLPACAAPASPAEPLATASLAGVELLVVEDNPVNLLIAETLLSEWGARVTKASDGAEAIAAFDAADGRFDAVLMDVHMPGMNGLEATAELRRRVGADVLPIIGLTAAVLREDLDAVAAAGMNDCVSKPFSPTQLRSAVARWTVERRAAPA